MKAKAQYDVYLCTVGVILIDVNFPITRLLGPLLSHFALWSYLTNLVVVPNHLPCLLDLSHKLPLVSKIATSFVTENQPYLTYVSASAAPPCLSRGTGPPPKKKKKQKQKKKKITPKIKQQPTPYKSFPKV